jgi:hypothetical protein
MLNTIIEAMARTLWVDAWASWAEREGCLPSQCELMDEASETPDFYPLYLAGVVWGGVRHKTRRLTFSSDVELTEWCKAHGFEETERLAQDWGHYLMMEALGSGVGWSDSYPDHDLLLPNIEAHCPDGETLELH